MTALEYRAYHAWDASTRWFHWINALALIGLIATGLVVLNDDALGLSAGGKILAQEHPCVDWLRYGGEPPLAFHLGILWQSLYAVAGYLARWLRLFGEFASLYRFFPVR